MRAKYRKVLLKFILKIPTGIFKINFNNTLLLGARTRQNLVENHTKSRKSHMRDQEKPKFGHKGPTF